MSALYVRTHAQTHIRQAVWTVCVWILVRVKHFQSEIKLFIGRCKGPVLSVYMPYIGVRLIMKVMNIGDENHS